MISDKKQSIIIVAGGQGLRAGGDVPKQFQLLGGEPILMRTVRAFYDYSNLIGIVLVLPESFCDYWQKLCEKHRFPIPHTVVVGGETRFHSVQSGLAKVSANEIVGVHDGARPFVSPQLIAQCFEAAETRQCGIVPVIDETNSMRLLAPDSTNAIIDRKMLKIVQTPQVFPASMLKKAYEAVFDPAFTDDASVAERHGMKIELIPGEETNIKITTSFDILIGELLVANR